MFLISAAGFAVERAADAGSIAADRLRQQWKILLHVGAGACAGAARDVSVDAVAAQINTQAVVRKDGIAQNRVVRAAIANAHPRVTRPTISLAEGQAVDSA